MKLVKRAVLMALCAGIVFWLGSLAVCEYETYRYGEQFRQVVVHDIGGRRFLEDETIKVLRYNDAAAEIYAVSSSREQASLYWFEKPEESEWAFAGWDTVWSKSGSADDYVFPYVRIEGLMGGRRKG